MVGLPGNMPVLLLLLTFLLPAEVATEKIIGGHEAKPHSHPYMALIYSELGEMESRCGGALVEEEFVLTAAHCKQSSMKVILGAHNIHKKEKTQQLFSVKKAFPHPDFVSSLPNDIILLQLERKAKLTNAVQPLRLREDMTQMKPGDTCLVAGWGRLDTYTSTNILHEVELTAQNERRCQRTFLFYNNATMICMGDPKGKKCTFLGDSGGPLVCNNTIQGISSSGPEQAEPPDVFVKVSHFLPWIKSIMKRF